MSITYCDEQCCRIQREFYKHKKSFFEKDNSDDFPRKRQKAGIFIYDPGKKKILLVQSRGHLWGPPKGTVLDEEESSEDCAIREVKEETGLDIIKSELSKYIKIKNNATYFYLEMPECSVEVQTQIENNDANGIGWIKTDCLDKLIKDRKIMLNQHCRVVIQRFLGISYYSIDY